jgi:hypothetical protein
MTFRKSIPCWVLLAMILPVARASADPVQLTYAQFVWDDETTTIRLDTSTFQLSALFRHSAFQVMPHVQCWQGGDCVPGTTFDAGFQTISTPINLPSPASFPGNIFNGEVYRDLFIDGSLSATGSGIVPGPIPQGSATLTESYPVSLTGFVNIFSDSTRATQLASAELLGSGTVSILWVRGSLEAGTVKARRENYEFTDAGAPVPEPGTMLLVGSGALALLRRRRHRAA